MKKRLVWLMMVCAASVSFSDIIVNYQGGNIANDKYVVTAYVQVGVDGSGSRSAVGNVNFPGSGTVAAVSGSVSSSSAGDTFGVKMDAGAYFDNVPTSSQFGWRITNGTVSAANEGAGVTGGAAGAGVGNNEGFAFNIDTSGLASGEKLKLTKITVENFDITENESVTILNNVSGQYMTVNADESGRIKTIDVSSLGIEVLAGHAMDSESAVNPIGGQAFTVMTGTAIATGGWRLESVEFTVIPEPTTMGLFMISGSIITLLIRRQLIK